MVTSSVSFLGEKVLRDPGRQDQDRYYPKTTGLQKGAKNRRFGGYERAKRCLVDRIRVLREARVGVPTSVQVILCLRTDPVTEKVLSFMESWAGDSLLLKVPRLEEFSQYDGITLSAGKVLVTGHCLTCEAPGIGRYHKTALNFGPDALARFQLKRKQVNFNEPADSGWALQEIALKLEIVVLTIVARELELAE